ncbi:MAG: type II toxin-antitoxin system MqsA family antitoxin [Anaerolineales bacterium]
MICPICREAELLHGLTSLRFERDEFQAVINIVPAQVCPACGEAFLDEEVTTRVLNQAEQISQEGLLEIAQDYA